MGSSQPRCPTPTPQGTRHLPGLQKPRPTRQDTLPRPRREAQQASTMTLSGAARLKPNHSASYLSKGRLWNRVRLLPEPRPQPQDQPSIAHSTGDIPLSVRSCPLPESTRVRRLDCGDDSGGMGSGGERTLPPLRGKELVTSTRACQRCGGNLGHVCGRYTCRQCGHAPRRSRPDPPAVVVSTRARPVGYYKRRTA